MLAALVYGLYALSIFSLIAYAVGQYHLLYQYWRRPPRPFATPRDAAPSATRSWPRVTVQIPLYNEQFVAAATIDACAAMRYPRDRFDIQVLDDSTDETVGIVDERAADWRSKGVEVNAVRRASRRGFKAGALADATPSARGELIAIFDADFRPDPDFLEKLVPEFDDAKVGAVQARWGHLNRDYSILTLAQSLLHDAFFVVEQEARARSGYFIRFNGSAGIWRRTAIDDSGGWSAETLSEDMDLAYRAQLRGWRFVYRRDVVAPAELPVTIADYHTQQHRWHKGRTQVVRKLLGPTLRAKLSPMVKLHALFDQLNAAVVPGVFVVAIAAPLYAILSASAPWMRSQSDWFILAQVNIVLLPAYAWLAMRVYAVAVSGRLREVWRTMLPVIILSLGMNFWLTLALAQGAVDKTAEFRRTSKYRADAGSASAWRATAYAPRRDQVFLWGSAALAVVFTAYLVFDVRQGIWGLTVFHAALALGSAAVAARAWRRA